jgi:hypothetical protein
MLDFVQPAGSGGRVIGGRRLARADETDRRESSPAGRGAAPDVPQAAFTAKAAPLMESFSAFSPSARAPSPPGQSA